MLLSGLSPATQPDWGTEPEERWGRVFRGEQVEVLPSERGAWDLFYPAFAAAIRGEGSLPVDPCDAVRTAEVLDAARRECPDGPDPRDPLTPHGRAGKCVHHALPELLAVYAAWSCRSLIFARPVARDRAMKIAHANTPTSAAHRKLASPVVLPRPGHVTR